MATAATYTVLGMIQVVGVAVNIDFARPIHANKAHSSIYKVSGANSGHLGYYYSCLTPAASLKYYEPHPQPHPHGLRLCRSYACLIST